MSITTEAPPRPGAADTARTAALFLDLLAERIVGFDLSTLITPGHVDIQIPLFTAGAEARRMVLAGAASALGGAAITTTIYTHTTATDWGSLHATATWCGVRVDVWTALTRAEARAAGLAVCTECGHADHDTDTTCLAAGWDTDGLERACECGAVDTAPVDLTLAAYAHDWARQQRDDEAWEARRDAARDDFLERCQDIEDAR